MNTPSPTGAPALLALPIPALCPGCCVAWDEQAVCPKCNLTRADISGVMQAGCAIYERARDAALHGRFDTAAGHLADLSHLGIPELVFHPAVCKLRELISHAVREQLPDTAGTEYDSARRAAAANDWSVALTHAANAARGAPASLPVGKLHALCLYGVGRESAAERLRRDLLRSYPDDADLPRWQFILPASQGRVRVVRAPIPKRRPAPLSPSIVPTTLSAPLESVPVPFEVPSPPPPPRSFVSWVPAVAVAGCLLGLSGLVMALIGLRRPATAPPVSVPIAIVTASPTPGPDLSLTPSPASSGQETNLSLNPGAKDGIFKSPLQREWEASRQASDEQQARRWFNAAVTAQKAGEHRKALQLAEAAATAGKSTYVYEDALLLQAKCADNLKRADSPALFARLADERPRSEYAPVALLLAAKAAQRRGDIARSEDYIRRLRTDYPRSAEAARASRPQSR